VRAMRAHGEGRITLRTHHVPALSLPTVDERLIRTTRERLRVSRTAFARRLGVTPRTLERWEEGRSTPNDQAAALTCWSGSILTRCRAWGRSRQPGRSEGPPSVSKMSPKPGSIPWPGENSRALAIGPQLPWNQTLEPKLARAITG